MVKDENPSLPMVEEPIVPVRVEISEPPVMEEVKEEPGTLPKIRLKVEEEAVKVKQFATAQSLSMHNKVVEAKRTGLTALHRIATWLTPKKK